ncbi:hypothetical protein BSA16_34005 [Micromonospora sp. Rc5]|uniref:hypothetical protein n=1 Tax=Micromonospora sp. Rc5 TaxID=1920666 RepID=UPI00098D6CF8|nr:hypothetical protein [Micromonospora sp. Rc5]MDI5937938.1 hypothetical protein [Micromonospora sp. DH15]OON27053.1 hypothetical protein BSA16_34005 [Micromonospora sp. Rc5]
MRVGIEDRAAFYRRLREMKLRRRAIADAMLRLSVMVGALQREVSRVDDRGRATDQRLVDETLALTKDAAVSVGVAAAEFHSFSRARIYYRSAVSA